MGIYNSTPPAYQKKTIKSLVRIADWKRFFLFRRRRTRRCRRFIPRRRRLKQLNQSLWLRRNQSKLDMTVSGVMVRLGKIML